MTATILALLLALILGILGQLGEKTPMFQNPGLEN